jgi:TPR repeat protein
LYILAEIHIEGMGDLVEQSDTKARILMKESANLGFLEAQVRLGVMYRGLVDMNRAAFYSTLAYSQDRHPLAGYVLGTSFLMGLGGLSKSLHRAKHYLEEAAVEGGYMPAYADLALTLLEMRKAQCGDGNVFFIHKVAGKEEDAQH